MMNTDFARRQMIEQQVRAWEVLNDDVLSVLGEVPRERFVPAGFSALAFSDTEIPIGFGESMMTPTMEGRVLQALELSPVDSVLEIGTGSGFLAACLATLARQVVSIDVHQEFIERCDNVLADLAIDNVDLIRMDATRELPEGRFDAIAVTGSMERFDDRLVERLEEGGRLFCVVGKGPAMQAMRVRRGEGTSRETEVLFETSLQPLANGLLPPRFSF